MNQSKTQLSIFDMIEQRNVTVDDTFQKNYDLHKDQYNVEWANDELDGVDNYFDRRRNEVSDELYNDLEKGLLSYSQYLEELYICMGEIDSDELDYDLHGEVDYNPHGT